MTWLLVAGGLTGALIALILALPCEACRQRRARINAAYAAWREVKKRAS